MRYTFWGNRWGRTMRMRTVWLAFVMRVHICTNLALQTSIHILVQLVFISMCSALLQTSLIVLLPFNLGKCNYVKVSLSCSECCGRWALFVEWRIHRRIFDQPQVLCLKKKKNLLTYQERLLYLIDGKLPFYLHSHVGFCSLRENLKVT